MKSVHHRAWSGRQRPEKVRHGLLMLFLGLVTACCPGCEDSTAKKVTTDPTTVVVSRPTVLDVTDFEEFTGHTEAMLSVQVRARVTGYLDEKYFKDGQEVQQGDLLYKIDDRPYKAALDRAEATLARADAHRHRLELDFHRASNLFQKTAIGRQEFDLISSDYAEAVAASNSSRALLDVAKLNMDFTRVRASMSGQLSRTLVDPGNLVMQEVTLLNDIVAVEKLYVYFDLNEQAMTRVSSLISQGRVGGVEGKEVPVEVGTTLDADLYEDFMNRRRELRDKFDEATKALRLQQGPEAEKQRQTLASRYREAIKNLGESPQEFPYHGSVNFSENKLDAVTGTLRIRGIIANTAPSILCPGLFVRVHLPNGQPHTSLLVPDEAISSDQGRRFVYVIDALDAVQYRPVEIGSLYTGVEATKMRAITSGLKADDRFIVNADGIRSVRPGAKVAPILAPKDQTRSELKL